MPVPASRLRSIATRQRRGAHPNETDRNMEGVARRNFAPRIIARAKPPVSAQKLTAGDQPNLRESALAELQQMLAAGHQQQIPAFDDSAIDAHRTLAELARRL